MRLLAVLAVLPASLRAQQCYYPNGDPVTAEPVAPCYSWGGICCPVGWTCLSNNLCHRQIDSLQINQTGRYSCVDQDWGKSCPDFCRDDRGSASGDEAVQSCGDGSYCCNGRGLDTDQCCQTGTSFFTPGIGTPVSAISTATDTDTMVMIVTSSLTTHTTATTTTVHRTMQTQTTQSVVSSSGSAPTTIRVIIISTSLVPAESGPTAAPAAHPSSDSSSKSILGKAVGIPVAVICASLLIGMIYAIRRYRQWRRRNLATDDNVEPVKDDVATTEPSSPVAGEFIGISPVFGERDEVAWEDRRPGSDGSRGPVVSELGGTEVLQLHEEPQISELPARHEDQE